MSPAARLPLALSLPLAAAAGAVHTVVFPPVGAAALAWVALVPALLLLRAENRIWAGTLLGWSFGLAAGAVAAHWLYDVLAWELGLRRLVSAAFAAGVVALNTSAFAGFGALAVALRRGRVPFALAAPLAWSAAEWARSELLGEMPWLLYGHSQYESVWVLQLAELGGVPAVTFVLVAVNALLAEASLPAGSWRMRAERSLPGAPRSLQEEGSLPVRTRKRRLRRVAGAAGVMAAALGIGAWRTATFSAPGAGDPVPVGLVQAATPQRERWRPETRRRNLQSQLALTRRARERGARLVVWSETALDFQPGELPEPEVAGLLDGALGSGPAWALVGAVAQREPGRRANAAVLFDAAGRRVDAYDKVRLVPFVERGGPAWLDRLPALSRRLRKMTAQRPYAAGRDASPIEVAGLRLGVLICYEAIYPDRARAAVEAGANVLLNLSNDGFFSAAGVAEQHLAMSVFRAVETRRPLVRVANRGVGAVVDPLGRIRRRIERDVRAAPVVEVAPREGRTLYTRGGHRLGEALALAALLGCLPSPLARSSAKRGGA